MKLDIILERCGERERGFYVCASKHIENSSQHLSNVMDKKLCLETNEEYVVL